MPIIKCKMCGGDIQLAEDKTFGTCEYCGSTMTFPMVSDEQRAAAFNRGNHFRRAGEFDKALGVYEHIVADDDTDAEAHWCCSLCRFGIEYVEDPATYEWLPTCHRASFDSFLEDVDYLAALEHSDGITRRQYQKDAAKIAEVQRGILAASQNTEPYDVFISYKELDENGERTRDSILAQEIYYRLTEKGWRVFFSRISLEDVPGTQYEPYIFAALNSAKVMVVVGTSAENLNAVWVKNEWSRFLAMMRKDRSKLLIPCFRDMDPYDLPEQLSVLMSYDMSRIGFIQDLIRGVDKVLGAEKKEETVVVQQSGDSAARITAAMDRGFMALEDGEWDIAVSFFDQALSLDAKNARAYYGMALAKAQCRDAEAYINKLCAGTPETVVIDFPTDANHTREVIEKYTVPGYLSEAEIKELYDYGRIKLRYSSTVRGQMQLSKQARSRFEADRNLVRARQFAVGEIKMELDELHEKLIWRLDKMIKAAEVNTNNAREAVERNYRGFIDEKDNLLIEKHLQATSKRESDYQSACKAQETADSIQRYQEVICCFKRTANYKDSAEKIRQCEAAINEIGEKERLLIDAKKKAEVVAKREAEYQDALQRFERANSAVDYTNVKPLFLSLMTYKDSAEMAKRCDEEIAAIEKAQAEEKERQRIAKEKAEKAQTIKENIRNAFIFIACAIAITLFFIYTKIVAPTNKYNAAETLLAAEEYESALSIYHSLGNYKDSSEKYLQTLEQIKERDYVGAQAMLQSGQYMNALHAFRALSGYKDVDELLTTNENLLAAAYQEWLSAVKIVGNTVSFGRFEQDNNKSNGKEEIEWIVLDVQSDRSLLISKYALNCYPYNSTHKKVSWENCGLRSYLNSSFITVFNAYERARIQTVANKVENRPNATIEDQVFLLDIYEAEKYFKSDEDRRCEPTAFAKEQGANDFWKKTPNHCFWWLRSKGSDDHAPIVYGDGSIDYGGFLVEVKDVAIRPALWVMLD